MKTVKAVVTIFALQILLMIKMCELVFVLPAKAVKKKGGSVR